LGTNSFGSTLIFYAQGGRFKIPGNEKAGLEGFAGKEQTVILTNNPPAIFIE